MGRNDGVGVDGTWATPGAGPSGSGSNDDVVDEDVVLGREVLLQAKRRELAQVVDKHDDLVREAFHLERFVTLVRYDPKAAKEDKSAVFEEWSEPYNLLRNTLHENASPARKTRGAVQGRRSLLTAPGSPMPRPLNTPRGSPSKPKDRTKREVLPVPSSPTPSRPASPNKVRFASRSAVASTSSPQMLPVKVIYQPKVDLSLRKIARFPSGRVAEQKDESHDKPSLASTPPPRQATPPSAPTPSTSKTIRIKRPSLLAVQSNTSQDLTSDLFLERIETSQRPRHPLTSSKHKAEESPTESPRPIKRIKVVHRPPPLEYSDPWQIPPPPSFQYSLSALLDSFIYVGEDQTIPADEVHRLDVLAEREARKRNKIEEMRAMGVFEDHERKIDTTPPEEPKRSLGHWDHLLSHMAPVSRAVREVGKTRVAGAKRVAKIVERHFEQIADAAAREQRSEERRKLVLAKLTLREVVKPWKLAIAVIRARKKQEVKNEQLRKGKQHLEAFLDKSTQVLEAQYSELVPRCSPSAHSASRSRSPSSSLESRDGTMASNSRASSPEMEASFALARYNNGIPSDCVEAASSADGDLPDKLGESSSSGLVFMTEYDEDSEADALVEEMLEGDSHESVEAPQDVDFNVSSQQVLSSRPTPSDPLLSAPLPEPSSRDLNSPRTSNSRSTSISSVVPHSRSGGWTDSGQASIHRTDDDESITLISTVTVAQMPEKDTNTGSGSGTIGDIAMGVPIPDTVRQYSAFPGELKNSIRTSPRSLSSLLGVGRLRLRSGRTAFVRATNDHNIQPVDLNDGDYIVEELEATEEVDFKLAIQMEEAEADDSDHSEVDGLAQDADVPIDELLRRYGYTADIDDLSLETGHPVDVDEEPAADVPVVYDDNFSERDPQHLFLGSPSDVGKSANIGCGISVTSPRSDVNAEDEDDRVEMGDHKPAKESLALADPRVPPPFLLRGTLRPYQQAGLEWLASLYTSNTNGILADEMGLGKTIQTIALLGWLACSKGIWGPHLIVVPTSVLLNWEMEFKRFLPGFKTMAYYGSQKERREKRQGWTSEHAFNVCITSYQLVLADQQVFRRKKWNYMILDEAHNIKNFKSKRWETLLCFNAQHRLLLTGTPLQNNLMELWSLLYFLMPDEGFVRGIEDSQTFVRRQDFRDLFQNPMEHAIESGHGMDDDTRDTLQKLHSLLRPYLLRRMKSEVEKELPAKHEHIVYCRLSKRQRLLYDEFMCRASTRETLASGNFLSVVNCLMQLRKVCNHPNLFEIRPITTSFAMTRSAVADYEIQELLVRRRLLQTDPDETVDLRVAGLLLTSSDPPSLLVARSTRRLDASPLFPNVSDTLADIPPMDTRTLGGWKAFSAYRKRRDWSERWKHRAYINHSRCGQPSIYSSELLRAVGRMVTPLLPLSVAGGDSRSFWSRVDLTHAAIQTYAERLESMSGIIDRFACITPKVVAQGVARCALTGSAAVATSQKAYDRNFDTLHRPAVKLQIAFPDASLIQFDCGKLQELDALLRMRAAGGHRVLIFTQMTRVLDILEIFLNFHGYRYLRLDGATKIEQRQIITERFNVDNKIFAFIASSRSGGIGINLTGADTVIFYDSDYNPSMDRQCEDRAHRIGQTREVHIYRFISSHTVEEALLRKANQKRILGHVVIQDGEFDWRRVLANELEGGSKKLEDALAVFEDKEDVDAAKVAAAEIEVDLTDFTEGASGAGSEDRRSAAAEARSTEHVVTASNIVDGEEDEEGADDDDDDDETVGLVDEYLLTMVEREWEFFSTAYGPR